MDELDQRIMSLLQIDGRIPNAEIARKLGVSEGTVRRRVGRLLQDDVIRITAVPNIEKMGYAATALVGVQTRSGWADDVAEALARLEEVHYAAVTTGAFDVFIWIGLESAQRLGDFLHTKVAPVEGIQRTETFLNLGIKKRTYGVPL
ncbi:MAG: Lrp/AsnC family transcriptional regulator [Chloroflexi bacterium]|nr:Lrp/AsnC family transcriptional regulator [Chloroflexota bacterium]MCI0794589.1 Lrp/AsnC family transcriptional regulator [Chloroflexota bacterium]MCI0799575.1 Lrp/AsnC family transcriptional regulator [Chloroflexota bacterium]MCI0859229.1 Lrp/AsnC family transcriptional regulator [Chloroflexota bacterium]MCI0895972.1 Lrp/AsnC family transcriptional regulator [Chloroflexota bacterium]